MGAAKPGADSPASEEFAAQRRGDGSFGPAWT